MASIPRQVIKSDILIVGGGPAGLSAAIRAADCGVKDIVIAEKSNTVRSGNGAGGNDHFLCYIPQYHGTDPKPVLKEFAHSIAAFFGDFSYVQTWLDRSFEMVKIWDSWGIPMKYKGRWEFAGHAFPGRTRFFLKYAGGKQKPILSEQALKRGVRIKNRITVFELLKEGGRVCGALGYDTWAQEVIEFHAKAVFLGTGGCYRLYKGSTGWMFNLPNSPYNTGDGRAMAIRAGADCLNLELTRHWAGPKYFARSGKASWIGVFREPSGKPVGPFINKPSIETGDVISDAYPQMFDECMRSGKGPIYQDCGGASGEEIDYMTHWLRNEGNVGLLRFLEKEGIDLRNHQIEFRTYEPFVAGGLWYSNRSETSVTGLYAAGDENFGGMAHAAIWGWIAGETMARDIKGFDFADPGTIGEQVAPQLAEVGDLLSRKAGPDWEEANVALQEIMSDYAASVRSETLLDQGMRNLSRLREKINEGLSARNGHEVGRCLEVRNLLDVGEAVMFAAQTRKETRGGHVRADYPYSNPLLDQQLLVRKEGGKFVGRYKNLRD